MDQFFTLKDFDTTGRKVRFGIDGLNRKLEIGLRELKADLDIGPKGAHFPHNQELLSPLEKGLNDRNKQLEAEIAQLRRENEVLKRKIRPSPGATRQSELANALIQRGKRLEKANRRLFRENDTLRDINNTLATGILPLNSDEHDHEKLRIDDHMVQIFTTIRERIHRIVHRHCQDDLSAWPIIPDNNGTDMAKLQRQLLGEWKNHLSMAQIHYRIRAALYQVIHSLIVTSPSFELEGFEWGQDEAYTDEGLRMFELYLAMLNNDHDHNENPAESKERTVKYASRLWQSRRTSAYNSKARQLALKMEQLMAPIIRKEPSQTLQNALFHLCQSTLDFMLLLKLSTDKFKIEIPQEGEDAVGYYHEIYGAYGDQPEAFWLRKELKIAFALTGTLIKYPQGMKEPVVLSKAYVLIRGI